MAHTLDHLKSRPFATSYSDFTVKWASLEWEFEQALELRRKVFCLEQALFDQHDRDEPESLSWT